jgi:hypothetical protein
MIRYGFKDINWKKRTRSLIRTVMDPAFFVDAYEQHTELEKHLTIAEQAGSVILEEIPGQQEIALTFDFARSFLRPTKSTKQKALQASIATLVAVCNTNTEDSDPLLNAKIGRDVTADGLIGMHVEIQWPSIGGSVLAKLATRHMRQLAVDLRYRSDTPRVIRTPMVYAQVNRARGITLETDPDGACNLGSDPARYEPGSPCIELVSNNICDPKQQVICLTGAIAVAHADELVMS